MIITTHLLDKIHSVILACKPEYNEKPVLIQKGQFLDMSPKQLKDYSNEIMLGLMAHGGSRPVNTIGRSMVGNAKFFELSVRGLKNQPEQELEFWLTNLVRKFIDYSDDIINDIQVTDDISKIGYTQHGNLEMSYMLIVNTVNLYTDSHIRVYIGLPRPQGKLFITSDNMVFTTSDDEYFIVEG